MRKLWFVLPILSIAIFVTACDGSFLARPEQTVPRQEQVTPTNSITVTEEITRQGDFSAENIRVEKVIDLENQFIETYQGGTLSALDTGESPQNVSFAGWSFDGKYMALTVWFGEIQEFPYQDTSGKQGKYRLGIRHLWITDGSNYWEIAPNAILPQWSPNGKWIAFLTDALIDGFYNHELWIVSPDGQHRQLLVKGVREYTWLDNESLIYIKGVFHGDRFWKVGTVDQQVKPIDIIGSQNNKLNAPSVSSDMHRIAFSNIVADKSELWIGTVGNGQITVDTTVPRQGIAYTAWSPDNDLLAIVGHDDPFQIIQANGTKTAQLDQKGGNSPPAWSPNGKVVAFTSQGQLFITNAGGSQFSQLIDLPEAYIDCLFWSSNGKLIGFNSHSGVKATILSIEKK